jgi:hypothetical protein
MKPTSNRLLHLMKNVTINFWPPSKLDHFHFLINFSAFFSFLFFLFKKVFKLKVSRSPPTIVFTKKCPMEKCCLSESFVLKIYHKRIISIVTGPIERKYCFFHLCVKCIFDTSVLQRSLGKYFKVMAVLKF